MKTALVEKTVFSGGLATRGLVYIYVFLSVMDAAPR